MYMLLYLQRRTFLFHLHADHDVQVLCLRGSLLIILAIFVELRCIGILHIVTGMMAITCLVYTFGYEVIVEFLHHVVLTLQVNHRTSLTFLIYKEEAWDMSILGHLRVVSTKGRRDMHDTSTILCRHIVSWNHTESLTLHLDKLILAILTCKDLLGMSLGIGLHIVGSILIEFS